MALRNVISFEFTFVIARLQLPEALQFAIGLWFEKREIAKTTIRNHRSVRDHLLYTNKNTAIQQVA